MFSHIFIPLQRFPLIFPVTTSIILIQTVVFIMLLFSGQMEQTDTWIRFGAFVDWKFDQGEWWRLLTASFVNVQILQFIISLFFHYAFAPQLEWLVGRFAFLFFYLVTTFVGNMGYVIFDVSGPQLGPDAAIYGMFGFYIYIYLRRLIDPDNGKAMAILVVLNLILSWQNILVHTFAFIVGFILSFVMIEIKRLTSKEEDQDQDDQ